METAVLRHGNPFAFQEIEQTVLMGLNPVSRPNAVYRPLSLLTRDAAWVQGAVPL